MTISNSEPMTINRSVPWSTWTVDFHPLGIHNRDHFGTMIVIIRIVRVGRRPPHGVDHLLQRVIRVVLV